MGPSGLPSRMPSKSPSYIPSVIPSQDPSLEPTQSPSLLPTSKPSNIPSSYPSRYPTLDPTSIPSLQPTTLPSSIPSVNPSVLPSVEPSVLPTVVPSSSPSSQPSVFPSGAPSVIQSSVPTGTNSSKIIKERVEMKKVLTGKFDNGSSIIISISVVCAIFFLVIIFQRYEMIIKSCKDSSDNIQDGNIVDFTSYDSDDCNGNHFEDKEIGYNQTKKNDTSNSKICHSFGNVQSTEISTKNKTCYADVAQPFNASLASNPDHEFSDTHQQNDCQERKRLFSNSIENTQTDLMKDSFTSTKSNNTTESETGSMNTDENSELNYINSTIRRLKSEKKKIIAQLDSDNLSIVSKEGIIILENLIIDDDWQGVELSSSNSLGDISIMSKDTLY